LRARSFSKNIELQTKCSDVDRDRQVCHSGQHLKRLGKRANEVGKSSAKSGAAALLNWAF